MFLVIYVGFDLGGGLNRSNSSIIGDGVVRIDAKLELLGVLANYETELKTYLLHSGFTPAFNDLLMQESSVGLDKIPPVKYLLFLEVGKYSLENKSMTLAQIEEQYFDLHVDCVKQSVDGRGEKINVLELWVEQYRQKYGSDGVSNMVQEIETLRNS